MGGLLGAVVIPQLVVLAIGIALSVAAGYLLKPKSDSPIRKDGPSTLAERGSYIPYLVGRRRVGSVIGWVGDRVVTHSSQKGGKGSSSSKSANTTPLYAENGWHLICIGPAEILHAIYINGKRAFTGPIDRTHTPSGSILHNDIFAYPGSFTIYWGEPDQPVNTFLGDSTRVGIASRWPNVCYVVWNNIGLGSSPMWPVIEYDIEVAPRNQYSPVGTRTINTVAPDGAPLVGPTVSSFIYQLLFCQYPYGLSQEGKVSFFRSEEVDFDALDAIQNTLYATETYVGSIVAQDGDDVLSLLAAICQDVGILFAWDVKGYKWKPVLVRAPGLLDPIVTIDANLLVGPLPEIETMLVTRPIDTMVFAFFDKDRAFKQSTIGIADDGQPAQYIYNSRARKIDIRTAIQFEVANAIAERRSQEELAGATRYQIHLDRSCFEIYPGQVFFLPGVPTLLRAATVTIAPDTGKMVVDAVTDFYGAPGTTFAQNKPPVGMPTFTTAQDAFLLIEPPIYLLPAGSPMTVVVPRIRGNAQTQFAELWLSRDNVSYVDEATTYAHQTGGLLASTLPANGPNYLAQGPTIDIAIDGVHPTPDFADVLDLTADEDGWRSGRQIAIIEDEILFVRKVTPLGGTFYRLDGVLRARYDTVKAAHAAGNFVFIGDPTTLPLITDSMLAPDKPDFYAKSQATGLTSTLPLSSITGVNKHLVGKALGYLAPLNLRVDNSARSFSPCYKTGEDIPFKWEYQADGIRTGAGMFSAGRAIGAFQPWPRQADGVGFQLKIYDMGGVFKDSYAPGPPGSFIDALTVTYPNARLVAAFGSEPAQFKALLVNYAADAFASSVPLVVTKVT